MRHSFIPLTNYIRFLQYATNNKLNHVEKTAKDNKLWEKKRMEEIETKVKKYGR